MNSASHKRKFDPEFAAAEQAEKAAKKAAKEIDAESDKAGVEDEKAAKKAARSSRRMTPSHTRWRRDRLRRGGDGDR